jgi:hypothetical protein
MINNVTTSLLGLNDNSESDYFESEDDEDILANETELATKDKRGK